MCSVARDTVVPASRTGSSTALGVKTPVRPTEMMISLSSVCLTSGGYLYAAAQRGNLAVEPSVCRCANDIDLDDRAVDVEIQLAARLAHVLNLTLYIRRIGIDRIARTDRKTKRFQIIK